MEQTVKIRCRNNGEMYDVPTGSTLEDVYAQIGLQMEYGPVSARVNNKVEGMHYRVYKQKEVEFLSLYDSSALRSYTRTLFFVLNKAAHDLWPDCTVVIDIPVSNGYYVDLRLDRPVTPDDVNAVRQRMQEIIDANVPIHRHETTTEEAIRMFTESRSFSKVKLLQGLAHSIQPTTTSTAIWTTITVLCSPRQARLYLFGVEYYFDGLLLRIPSQQDPPSWEPS